MLDLRKHKSSSNKLNTKLKKSHICLFGSLLVIVGVLLLSHNYISDLKMKLFSEMELKINDEENTEEIIDGLPEALELPEENNPQPQEEKKEEEPPKPIDYSKYLGVLEIPRINLKRGFYEPSSRYNNIRYNVTIVGGSTMPDVENGNFILMSHSGNAAISFFRYLYKLEIGDLAYVTYLGNVYKYSIVNIYNVPKTGSVTISRNRDKTTMTLITCTRNSDTEQTIYILERV